MRRSIGTPRRLLGLLLVAGSIVAIPASASTQDEPLRFEGDGKDVTVTESTKVVLVSNVDEPVRAALTVALPGLEDADGNPIDPRTVVLVPPEVPIPAGQSAEVTVGINGLDRLELPKTGLRGHLDATTDADTARWNFVLKPAAMADLPTPAVTTWTVTLGGEKAGEDEGDLLPLKTTGTITNPVGTLQRSDGDTAIVTATATTIDERPYAKLTFEGLETGYVYKGSIDLQPNDKDAGAVELTASRTDGVQIAAKWMILGLLAAVVVKWFGSVFLPLRKLRSERRAAYERTQAADQEMESTDQRVPTAAAALAGVATPDEPLDPFKIFVCNASMDANAVAKKEVRDVWLTVTLALDLEDPHYVAAVDAIESLQQADDWGLEARKELHVLKRTLAQMTNIMDPPDDGPLVLAPPPGAGRTPPLTAAIEEHLSDRQIKLGEVTDTRATTIWMTQMLTTRTKTLESMGKRQTALEQLDELPLPWRDRDLLRSAERELAAARWHYWHATSPDDLVEGEVDERLGAVDDVIAQLSAKAPEGLTIHPAATNVGLEHPGLIEGFSAIDLPDVVAKVVEPLTRAGATVLTGLAGIAVLVFGAAASVVVALETVYKEPFGSPRQLLAAFAWGAGTVLVLQVVETSVTTVFGRRKRSEDEKADEAAT